MTEAVVGFVLERLENLLIHEADLFRTVKGDVNLLQDDLRIMNAFLKDSEGKGDGQEMVEVLIDLIRKAAFGAEDVINTYMAQVIKQRRRKLPMKLFHCFDQALVLHRVAKKTQSIKRRIENIYANKTTFALILDILKCVGPISEETYKMSDEELKGELRDKLKGKRYFVVMDDVWKPQFWDEMRACFPSDSNGSRILITSREKEVASNAGSNPPYFLPFLDKEASWELLCKKVFQEEKCPSNLESLGRQLAESCKGLPLSIVVLGEKFYEVRVNSADLRRSSNSSIPRRLSIQGNIDTESISSSRTSNNSISVGSLLLFNSYFHYNPLKWALKNFRFVRLLSIEVSDSSHRSPTFPKEIGQLVFLRYLKIAYTGQLRMASAGRLCLVYCWKSFPASICKLPYLETIHVEGWIVKYIPNEIWMMKQLRHLCARYGIELKPPSKIGHTLSNLKVLSFVQVDKETSILFRNSLFPNLRKLHLGKWFRGQIDESMASEILASLESLRNLQILKLSNFTFWQGLDLFPSSSSSSKLTKITFVDCEYLDSNHLIGSLGKLANLRILKIRGWLISPSQLHFMAGEFPQLEVFKMIDLRDIETWELETHAMPNLQHLVIKECTSLRNFPDEVWSLANLRMVEVSGIKTDLKEKLIFLQAHDRLKPIVHLSY
ncbi:hypothetical protein FEM48_Zijuj07G0050700 [Ziziphus jujuba var. spinosa]|uniref:Uncharacterized protein n=1 Tax=Ziziphus jujuba var. spinosa TaxID=714518 RepID=A0A978V2M0_ZIZJJ|nr:hypothetical protein FEM48_Zijuj07G0050700 [Ziziphus jujuba var. spinosa]